MVKLTKIIFLSFQLFIISQCFAIDNPDAPDYVNDFIADALIYESKLSQCDCSPIELTAEYEAFNQFLDQRLVHSERLVNHFVEDDGKLLFNESQASWEAYAKKEGEFILANWTKESFGSSYLLSRLDYLTSIKKQRIITLYYYAKNYPPL
ncbi:MULTISPECIES: hypothetical protein [unclassified Shewanella]|jgi:hypothetical protein|uniref:hypothetical protein n=1 Tax=unclassified Shewanella TaxID=196818 RepID=UPI00137BC96C|nr:hypothetical protein [Shewanella sp. Arc9-LZ]QHS13872.1 hypothetical protein GUY17_12475 [Shewanella sp. Arc9-LZ]